MREVERERLGIMIWEPAKGMKATSQDSSYTLDVNSNLSKFAAGRQIAPGGSGGDKSW